MMVQPTPWQANRTAPAPAPEPEPDIARNYFATIDFDALRARMRGLWGYTAALVGSLIMLVLLFEPWLFASGMDGTVGINAFGRMEITTSALNVWSQSPPAAVRVTGAWGILTAAAAGLTVCFVVINFRARSHTLSRLATISTLVSAGTVLIALIYFNTKGPDAKAMVGVGRDLGGQVGLLMRSYFGNGSYVLPGSRVIAYSSAGLTATAWTAGAVALLSAAAVVAQWIRDRPAEPDATADRSPESAASVSTVGAGESGA
ncbi:hypothetical protein [Nocardia blacklockiae]|uniref:hypothetical protein n=1 Tax=Nocardia blacklockiae TaxID=480036 RepID=UPI001895BC21|nr:hypothetical protein [Nocardia blacklockiae]MBF6172312.1 hypothetical protein [Nocardia blacklockiae]